MASKEQLAILKRGAETWNEWRGKNCTEIIDLSESNLSAQDFRNADFSHANLSYAVLHRANLRKANLSNAVLECAILSDADLSGAGLLSAHLNDTILSDATLCDSDLSMATVRNSDLCGANLTRARLEHAFLSGTKLNDANFSHSILIYTHFDDTSLYQADFNLAQLLRAAFVNCDLSTVRGLQSVGHIGPCKIGIDTLYKSGGKIPESFLRGCGVPEDVIQTLVPLIRTGSPIQFYSCFISYSSKDQEFADRLYADLQSKGVRCWLASEDLKIGDRFRIRIDESIRIHDKLLLVLSQHSVSSDWVEKEVETAMERECQEKRVVLFPIRLDDAVMEIQNGWPADIRRTRHIGDFTKWKHHDCYTKSFDRLLRNLKAAK